MQVQINTDKNITGDERLTQQVEDQLRDSLERFSEKITRIEAHISDSNSATKGGEDKRCLLEARLAGLQPISVSAVGEHVKEAVDDAIRKLKRSLDSTLGKLERH